MSENFERAFKVIVGQEGGYVNDPNDLGGETNYGISKAAFPDIDIKNLTLADAETIYIDHYWNACKCDEMPWPLALYVFDAAVNQGVRPAIQMMQQALGITSDGIIGNGTLDAAKNATDEHCAKFMALRAQRYVATTGYQLYGVGWLTRLFKVVISQ